MPWQHEQLSVTVQTITLWLYCSPGDEFHHELIWDQFSTPKTKPLPLQVLVSDQWQSTTSFMTPAATNTSLPPKISHFPATRDKNQGLLDKLKTSGPKNKTITQKHAVCEKLAHFLSVLLYVQLSGLYWVLGCRRTGPMPSWTALLPEWSVQWNLQSQNWPFQWHRNQNQMPQDWLNLEKQWAVSFK